MKADALVAGRHGRVEKIHGSVDRCRSAGLPQRMPFADDARLPSLASHAAYSRIGGLDPLRRHAMVRAGRHNGILWQELFSGGRAGAVRSAAQQGADGDTPAAGGHGKARVGSCDLREDIHDHPGGDAASRAPNESPVAFTSVMTTARRGSLNLLHMFREYLISQQGAIRCARPQPGFTSDMIRVTCSTSAGKESLSLFFFRFSLMIHAMSRSCTAASFLMSVNPSTGQ